MKDIMTAPFVREMCETTANMYRLGWDANMKKPSWRKENEGYHDCTLRARNV